MARRGKPKKAKKAIPAVSTTDNVIKTKGVLDEDGKTVLKGVVTE